MVETPETKKLRSILERIEREALESLKSADDMKSVHQNQAKLALVKEVTTQFFTERKPPNEPTTLRI